MVRQRSILCIVLLFALMMTGIGHRATTQQVEALNTNLLVNGNFDELPFQWAYPNHFIPEGWERWWIHGTVLPEFDDVKGPREHIYVDGGHALVYFKWGYNYTAGVFQVVEGLTPCRPYRLTMYARNHSLAGALPHARIGLDPLGQQLTPDGAVHDQTPLQRTVWSREQTALFQWEELDVTAEPIGNKLTAILYASPQPGSPATHYYDTFWDAGALREATYPNGKLPVPTQMTSDVTQQANIAGNSVVVNWSLGAPGVSQIWYNIVSPEVITPTPTMSHTLFMPLVQSASFNFDFESPLNYNPGTTYTATIADLTPGQTVEYLILVRRLTDNACITYYAGPYSVTLEP